MPIHRRQNGFDLPVLEHGMRYFFERGNTDESERTGASDSCRAIQERRETGHDMRNAGPVACLAVQVGGASQGWRRGMVQGAIAVPESDAKDRAGGGRSSGSHQVVSLQPRLVVWSPGDSLGNGRSGAVAPTVGTYGCADTVSPFVDPSTNRGVRTQRKSLPGLACERPGRRASGRLCGASLSEGTCSILFVELHGCRQSALRHPSDNGTGQRAGDQCCLGKLVETGLAGDPSARQRVGLLRKSKASARYGGADSAVPAAWGGALLHPYSRTMAQWDHRTIQPDVGS